MFDSVDSFADSFKSQNPEYEDWGPRTLYSTLVHLDPSMRDQVSGSPEPLYTDPSQVVAGYRDAYSSRLSGASDDAVLADMRANMPGLADAWGLGASAPEAPEGKTLVNMTGEPMPEEEEDIFGKAFPNWYGPRPTKPLDQYKNGARLQKLMDMNLGGKAGFAEGLAGDSPTDWVPYLNDAIEAVDAVGAIKTMKKASNPDEAKNLTEDEILDMNLYLGIIDREANASGWSKVGSGLRQMAVFMGEFGAYALMVAGAALEPTPLGEAGVVGVAGKQVAEKGAIKLARTTLRPWAKKVLGEGAQQKFLDEAAKQGIIRGGGAVNASLTGSGRLLMKQMADQVEEGTLKYFGNAVKAGGIKALGAKAAAIAARQAPHLAHAAIKTGIEQAAEMAYIKGATGEVGTSASIRRQLGQVLSGNPNAELNLAAGALTEGIENYTEMVGPDVMKVLGGLFSKTAGRVPGMVAARAPDLAAKYRSFGETLRKSIVDAAKAAPADAGLAQRATQKLASAALLLGHPEGAEAGLRKLQAVGYDGFLEEYAEERAGDFLRGLFGLEGNADRTAVVRALGNMIPDSSEDALVELAVLAVPTAGTVAAQAVRGKVSDWARPMQAQVDKAAWVLGQRGIGKLDAEANVPVPKVAEGEDPRKGNVIGATDLSSLIHSMKGGVAEAALDRVDQGPMMNLVDWVLRNTVGLRAKRGINTADGRGGVSQDTTDRYAAAGAVHIVNNWIDMVNERLSKNERFQQLRQLSQAQVEANGGALAKERRAIALAAAEETAASAEHGMRQYSSLIFSGIPTLTPAMKQALASSRGITVEDLEGALPGISKKLQSGDLDGLVMRFEGGRIGLKPQAFVTLGLSDFQVSLLPLFNINTAGGFVKPTAEIEAAEAVAKSGLVGPRQQSDNPLEGLSIDELAKIRKAYDALLLNVEVTNADIASADAPAADSDSAGVRIARAAMHPDRVSAQDLETLRVALGLPARAPGDRFSQHLKLAGEQIAAARNRTTPVEAEIVESLETPGSFFSVRVGDGAYHLSPVEKIEGTKEVGSVYVARPGVPPTVVTGASGIAKYRIARRNELEKITFIREQAEEWNTATAKALGANHLTAEQRRSAVPVKAVYQLDADGKPTKDIDIEKSIYRVVVSGHSSADGREIFITNFSRNMYDMLEELVETGANRALRAMERSGIDPSGMFAYEKGKSTRAVLRTMSEAARTVLSGLQQKLDAARRRNPDATPLSALSATEASLYELLSVGDRAAREGNLHELQGKVFLYADRGYSAYVDQFGYKDTGVMRAEAELFAQLAGDASQAEGADSNLFLAALHNDYVRLLGSEAVAAMGYNKDRQPADTAEKPAPTKTNSGKPTPAKPNPGKPGASKTKEQVAEELRAKYAERAGTPGISNALEAAGLDPLVQHWTDEDFALAGWPPGLKAKAKKIIAESKKPGPDTGKWRRAVPADAGRINVGDRVRYKSGGIGGVREGAIYSKFERDGDLYFQVESEKFDGLVGRKSRKWKDWLDHGLEILDRAPPAPAPSAIEGLSAEMSSVASRVRAQFITDPQGLAIVDKLIADATAAAKELAALQSRAIASDISPEEQESVEKKSLSAAGRKAEAEAGLRNLLEPGGTSTREAAPAAPAPDWAKPLGAGDDDTDVRLSMGATFERLRFLSGSASAVLGLEGALKLGDPAAIEAAIPAVAGWLGPSRAWRYTDSPFASADEAAEVLRAVYLGSPVSRETADKFADPVDEGKPLSDGQYASDVDKGMQELRSLATRLDMSNFTEEVKGGAATVIEAFAADQGELRPLGGSFWQPYAAEKEFAAKVNEGRAAPLAGDELRKAAVEMAAKASPLYSAAAWEAFKSSLKDDAALSKTPHVALIQKYLRGMNHAQAIRAWQLVTRPVVGVMEAEFHGTVKRNGKSSLVTPTVGSRVGRNSDGNRSVFRAREVLSSWLPSLIDLSDAEGSKRRLRGLLEDLSDAVAHNPKAPFSVFDTRTKSYRNQFRDALLRKDGAPLPALPMAIWLRDVPAGDGKYSKTIPARKAAVRKALVAVYGELAYFDKAKILMSPGGLDLSKDEVQRLRDSEAELPPAERVVFKLLSGKIAGAKATELPGGGRNIELEPGFFQTSGTQSMRVLLRLLDRAYAERLGPSASQGMLPWHRMPAELLEELVRGPKELRDLIESLSRAKNPRVLSEMEAEALADRWADVHSSLMKRGAQPASYFLKDLHAAATEALAALDAHVPGDASSEATLLAKKSALADAVGSRPTDRSGAKVRGGRTNLSLFLGHMGQAELATTFSSSGTTIPLLVGHSPLSENVASGPLSDVVARKPGLPPLFLVEFTSELKYRLSEELASIFETTQVDADGAFIRARRTAVIGDQSALDEYRAAFVMNRQALETGGDFSSLVNVGDKGLAYFVRLKREAVLAELAAMNASRKSGPRLDPGNAHDLMEVMDLMVSTRLLGSDSIGMEAATARAMQPKIAKRVRAVTSTTRRKFALVDGGMPAATKSFVVLSLEIDGRPVVEAINGQALYSADMAKRLAVSSGRTKEVGASKFMAFGGGLFYKTMNHRDSTGDMGALFPGANPNRIEAVYSEIMKLAGAAFVTDTGGAKFHREDAEVQTFEFELGGVRVKATGRTNDLWTADLYETTNVSRDTGFHPAVHTVSAVPNLPMRTAAQRARAAYAGRLIEAHAKLVLGNADAAELGRLAAKALENTLDPDLRQMIRSGADFRNPALRERVMLSLMSALAADSRPELPTAKLVLVNGEPLSASRGVLEDPFLRPMLDRPFGLLRANLSSPRVRYAWRLKPGKTKAEAAEAINLRRAQNDDASLRGLRETFENFHPDMEITGREVLRDVPEVLGDEMFFEANGQTYLAGMLLLDTRIPGGVNGVANGIFRLSIAADYERGADGKVRPGYRNMMSVDGYTMSLQGKDADADADTLIDATSSAGAKLSEADLAELAAAVAKGKSDEELPDLKSMTVDQAAEALAPLLKWAESEASGSKVSAELAKRLRDRGPLQPEARELGNFAELMPDIPGAAADSRDRLAERFVRSLSKRERMRAAQRAYAQAILAVQVESLQSMDAAQRRTSVGLDLADNVRVSTGTDAAAGKPIYGLMKDLVKTGVPSAGAGKKKAQIASDKRAGLNRGVALRGELVTLNDAISDMVANGGLVPASGETEEHFLGRMEVVRSAMTGLANMAFDFINQPTLAWLHVTTATAPLLVAHLAYDAELDFEAETASHGDPQVVGTIAHSLQKWSDLAGSDAMYAYNQAIGGEYIGRRSKLGLVEKLRNRDFIRAVAKDMKLGDLGESLDKVMALASLSRPIMAAGRAIKAWARGLGDPDYRATASAALSTLGERMPELKSGMAEATRAAMDAAGRAYEFLGGSEGTRELIKAAYPGAFPGGKSNEQLADMGRLALIEAVRRAGDADPFARLFILDDRPTTADGDRVPQPVLTDFERFLSPDLLAAADAFWKAAAVPTEIRVDGQTVQVPAESVLPLIAFYQAVRFGDRPARFRGGVLSLMPASIHAAVSAAARANADSFARTEEPAPAPQPQAPTETGLEALSDADLAAMQSKKDGKAVRAEIERRAAPGTAKAWLMRVRAAAKSSAQAVEIPVPLEPASLSDEQARDIYAKADLSANQRRALSEFAIEPDLAKNLREGVMAALQESGVPMSGLSEERLAEEAAKSAVWARYKKLYDALAPAKGGTSTREQIADNGSQTLYELYTYLTPRKNDAGEATRMRDSVLNRLKDMSPGVRASARAEVLRDLGTAQTRNKGVQFSGLVSRINELVRQLAEKDSLLADTEVALPPAPAPVAPKQLELGLGGSSTREVTPIAKASKRLGDYFARAGIPLDSEALRAHPYASGAHYELLRDYSDAKAALAAPTLLALADGDLLGAKAAADAVEGDAALRASLQFAAKAALSDWAGDLRSAALPNATLDPVVDASIEPEEGAAETFGGTSTYSFDVQVRDQISWLMRMGGVQRAHQILMESTWLANAIIEKNNADSNRLWNPFFHDKRGETVRKEYRTKSGDWNPITGFRKLRTSGAEHRYTEAERNEIARVMAAERAIQKNERTKDGKRIVVYGGQLRRNADGAINMSESIAVGVDGQGVPVAKDGLPANFEYVDDILRDWAASPTRKMLIEKMNKRAEDLDPEIRAKENLRLYSEIRDRVNRHAAFTIMGPDFLNETLNYGPQTYRGHGFDSVQVREALDRLNQDAARGAKNGNGSGLTADDLDAKPHERLSKTGTQDAAYLALMNEKFGPGTGNDSDAGRLAEVADLDRRGMNAAILRLAVSLEVPAYAKNKAHKMSGQRAALIAGIRNAISLYSVREGSARTLARSYDSYFDAYVGSNGRLNPTQTPPAIELAEYAAHIAATIRSRVVAQNMMLSRDQDGKFLVIGVPDIEFRKSQGGRMATQPDGGTLAIVNDATVAAQVAALEEELGIHGTPGADAHEKLAWIVANKLNSGYLSGYEEAKSPYDSVAKFWVKKGRPARIFAHLVGQTPRAVVEIAGRQHDLLQYVSGANQFMKHLALSWSAFFGTAGIESLTAGTGLKNNIWRRAPSAFRKMREYSQQIERGDKGIADTIYALHRAGLDLSGSRLMNESDSAVDRAIDRLAKWAERNIGEGSSKYVKPGARFLAGRWWSEFLMGKFFPGMKLWAAMDHIDQMKQKLPGVPEMELMRAAAPSINAAYGGFSWDEYAWATPKMVYWLNMFMFAPIWCCPQDTRALTKTGFKGCSELSVGEEILVFDPATKTTRWSPLRDKFVRGDYSGDMVTIKNYNHELAFTPEHTCYVVNRKGTPSIVKAKNLIKDHRIPRCAPYCALPESETVSDRMVSLAGWLATDGYVKSKEHALASGERIVYRYGRIVQSKPQGVAALDALGLKRHPHGRAGVNMAPLDSYTFNIPKREFDELESLGVRNGKLSWDFLERLTRRQLELLHDTLMAGDGTGRHRFCGQPDEVYFMGLVRTLLGRPVTYTAQNNRMKYADGTESPDSGTWFGRVRDIDATTIDCGGDRMKTVPYSGGIWCPSVDTGFWVAERNGIQFITGNTLSAWNIAGGGLLTGHLMGNHMSTDMEKFVFLKNWPAMYLIALQGFPNLMQAAIYAAAGLLGKAEPDDEPLAVSNELGKGGLFPSIDVTPIVRALPGYVGDPTGKRRIYIQFGKQSYEVLQGWLQDPIDTAMRKSSMIVKLAWEQMFGYSPGSPDFKLPFYGKGLAGFASSPQGFLGSRLGTAAQKVLPMSLISATKSPDTRVFAPFVPASKGMNQSKANVAMAEILKTYADAESWGRISGHAPMRANLQLLLSDYVDALARNGYDPETVIVSARGSVMPEYYAKFIKAMENGNEAAAENAAQSIYRLHGTVASLLASYSTRRRNTNRPAPTPEEQQAVKEAFGKYAPPVFAPSGDEED